MEDYPFNLCGWSWLRRNLFPFAWADTENRARKQEYRLRKVEAHIEGRPAPRLPSRILMR